MLHQEQVLREVQPPSGQTQCLESEHECHLALRDEVECHSTRDEAKLDHDVVGPDGEHPLGSWDKAVSGQC